MPCRPLPPELVLLVLQSIARADLDSHPPLPTLAACTLVNRTWYKLGKTILYNSVAIQWLPPVGYALVRAFRSNATLAPLVRTLAVDFPHSEDWMPSSIIEEAVFKGLWAVEVAKWTARGDPVPEGLRDSFRERTTITGAETRGLRWQKASDAGVDEWLREGRSEGAEVLAALITRLPSLLHLVLTNCDGIPFPPLPSIITISIISTTLSAILLPHAPNLKALYLDVDAISLPPTFSARELRALNITATTALPILVQLHPFVGASLRTLVISSMSTDDAPMPLLAEDVAQILPHFVGLKTLALVYEHPPHHSLSYLQLPLQAARMPVFLAALGSSTLRHLKGPFEYSPLLTQSLPTSLVILEMTVGADVPLVRGFIGTLVTEKRRLVNLASVELKQLAGPGDYTGLGDMVGEAREVGIEIRM
ncbi:hypothetical protein RQP46_002814 [Phenoliferia psychrophenolica]